MPILFVYGASGPAAFHDWRPIATSALLTSLHRIILNALVPTAVFPSDGGLLRVLLHGSISDA